jgi:hypothetical protein
MTTFWNAEGGACALATIPERHMVRRKSRAVDTDVYDRDE